MLVRIEKPIFVKTIPILRLVYTASNTVSVKPKVFVSFTP